MPSVRSSCRFPDRRIRHRDRDARMRASHTTWRASWSDTTGHRTVQRRCNRSRVDSRTVGGTRRRTERLVTIDESEARVWVSRDSRLEPQRGGLCDAAEGKSASTTSDPAGRAPMAFHRTSSCRPPTTDV